MQIKSKTLKAGIFIWCCAVTLGSGILPSSAQDSAKLVNLSQEIIAAESGQDLYPLFEDLKDLYLKENKYSECVEFLQSLSEKKKILAPFANYYIALSRYEQLKYLEEKQSWDEYFSKGNEYRDQLTASAQKAIDSTSSKEPLNIYARLILWQFHRDQQDTLHEQAFSDLVNTTLEYSQEAKVILPIKEAADKLIAYGEKAKARQFYNIYVDKLLSANLGDEELSRVAGDFLKEGNLQLAESVYDKYVERTAKTLAKEKLILIFIDLAQKFSYRAEGLNDPAYAEKIFKQIEEAGGKEAFNEELTYSRAFNLEKAKEYPGALENYKDLIQRFPASNHSEEANFKSGIFYTYVLKDIEEGRSYFEKLVGLETNSSRVISSLYQLGLLSQWEGDSTKAKEYYNKLLEKAKDSSGDTVALARERLREIEEAKPIEYNLKIFLDATFKEGVVLEDMSKSDLRASRYRPDREQDLKINSSAYIGESGCMQVALDYLWSGDLGKTKPSNNEPAFDTDYNHPGTKVVNLVIISPSGIIDRNIDIVDVK